MYELHDAGETHLLETRADAEEDTAHNGLADALTGRSNNGTDESNESSAEHEVSPNRKPIEYSS